MSFASILKLIFKNFMAFLLGTIICFFISIKFLIPLAIQNFAEKTGAGGIIGAIILVPVLLVIYGILSLIAGGFLGIAVYNIIKLILKWINKKSQ